MESNSARLNARTARGGGFGLRPASFAGLRAIRSHLTAASST
jgi:hypothetical protein